jgi:hypothetical protein
VYNKTFLSTLASSFIFRALLKSSDGFDFENENGHFLGGRWYQRIVYV